MTEVTRTAFAKAAPNVPRWLVRTIWIVHQAEGVSALSWSAYLVSALLWFWHGVRKRDRNIYLPCIGWIVADGAVIAGALVYG